MAVCAVSTSDGLSLQQMSSAADACSGVVLLQPVDVPPSIFTMDMQTGAEYSAAVAAVWLTAWGVKAAIRVLRDSETGSVSE